MRRCLFLILMLFVFTGCTHYAPPGENHPVRVVTAIDVSVTEAGSIWQCRFTDSKKMQAILWYLRALKPDQRTPITADTFRTDAYEITLHLSDGSQTVYHQIYDEYLKKDNGPWQSIDQTQGSSLPQLLAKLSADTA